MKLFLVCLLIISSILEYGAFGIGFGNRIKHIVALMFENRSFDHMLGWLKSGNPDINGCIPSMKECVNPYNPANKSSDTVPVGDNAVYIQPGDPGHSIGSTTQQIYGTNSNGNNINNIWPPPMNGFVLNYQHAEESSFEQHDHGALIMESFNSTAVPIISTLSEEFATFNSWFCDVPGPTEPNRLYSWLATSGGLGDDNHERLALGFTQMSIFQMLDEHYNKSQINWRVYMGDGPTPIFVDYTRLHPERYRLMPDFYDDVNAGDLPLFTWIDPGYLENDIYPPSSQHPDFNVLDGEKFMKRIYEKLRASSLWNDTLFLIFYDEHGGFYDHVPPPYGPNPDGMNVTVGPTFDFQRIGVRVPAILISPWINKGEIINTPPNNKYNNASQYTHSSLVHTIREQYTPNVQPLTKRDEWSLTFEQILMQRTEPRTDCPMKLPDVPDIGFTEIVSDMNHNSNLKPTDFHISIADTVAPLCGKSKKDVDENSLTQPILREFIVNCMKQWIK